MAGLADSLTEKVWCLSTVSGLTVTSMELDSSPGAKVNMPEVAT